MPSGISIGIESVRPMPPLLDLQSMMRRSLIRCDDAAISTHIVAAGLSPAHRLAIYRNTFCTTVTKSLRLTFPAVSELVGAEFFDGAAYIFSHETPPRIAYLDDYGAEFPEFLGRFPPAASLAYLSDVARLEWAVSRAIHAPDVALLELRQLANLDATAERHIRFYAHPSLSLLQLNWDADVIWRAVLDDDDAALGKLDLTPGRISLVVSRHEGHLDVARVPEDIFGFMSELCAGRELADAMAAHPRVAATAILADMLSKHRFSHFKLNGNSSHMGEAG